MARGPFQGTWQEGLRPTVVTAPDAIVYVNGKPSLLACNSCRRRFDLNKYVTSVQVDLSVDNAPGSASVSLTVPRHTVDDFFIDGVAIVAPMMEIEIYAKGYYLVNGLAQYYPIFWGLITEVSDNYSSGEHTFSISCADILKWWELCRLNVTPAFTQAAGQLDRNITGNAFDGANCYDIIWTLAQQSFGDIVQAKGSLEPTNREAQSGGIFSGVNDDIMAYWNARFGQMRSSLLLYGVEGAAVRGDVIYDSQSTSFADVGQKVASSALRNANGGEVSSQVLFSPTETVFPFRSNLSNTGSPNFWQSEYQTKLEIANVCKEAVGFEFYMDVTGDIVFKPPFYNLDILGNKPISWIQDIDIIDWNISESEAEVITQIQMSGSAEGGSMDTGITSEVNTPVSQVTDYHLLRRYGWRTQSLNAEYLKSTEAMFYAGLDMLDRVNCRRHRATVTIPMRPELRLGFPIYLAPKDQIWYITGISHNLTFGGRAQTQLTLTARRGKFIAPRGIGTIERVPPPGGEGPKAGKATSSPIPLAQRLQPTARELSATGRFKLEVGAAAELPPTNLQVSKSQGGGEDPYAPLILRHPKTGRIVGYPNVNMAYTRPFNPDDATFNMLTGGNTSPNRKAAKIRNRDSKSAAAENLRNLASNFVQNTERDLTNRHLDNRFIYGMTDAGVYTYVHDKSRVIQEIIQLPAQNIDVVGATVTAKKEGTATLRPVSDERGFEVIGHYRYGRGVSLRDGSLVLTNEGQNRRTLVDTQLALAGGLFETLRAQSQGLTTLTSGYGNPADAVARMTPSDLQTAGTMNPTTGEPEFTANGQRFVDTAPLNSAANKGQFVSVEASQLSRALTLAEMRVKEDFQAGEENCACLLGRSDLAFINVGYQVEFLKGTAADNSSQARSNAEKQAAEINEQIARLTSQIGTALDDPLLTAEGEDAVKQKLADLAAERDGWVEAKAQLEAALTATTMPIAGDASLVVSQDLDKPVSSTVFSLGQTITRVETFLSNLYEALDAPHQAYEDALRGKLISGPSRSDLISGNEEKPQYSPFSPPFSASSRAVGGDPAALALQGSSALSGLADSWKSFGEDLRREPKRAILTRQVDDATKKLERLDAEETRLQALKKSGVLLQIEKDAPRVSEQLENLQAERTKTTQQLENAALKLRQLEAQP